MDHFEWNGYKAILVESETMVAYNRGDIFAVEKLRIPEDSADMQAAIRDYIEFLTMVTNKINDLQKGLAR